eukprot:1918457-Ditylum_brightwellii.AAC.1
MDIQNTGGNECLSTGHSSKVEGYETIELNQWEIYMQFHLHGASEKVPTTDIGDKVRSLIVKLYEIHEKENILIFTKNRK